MIKLYIPQYLISGMLIGLGGPIAANAPSKVVKEVPVRMISSLEGKDLYNQYCAVTAWMAKARALPPKL
jgi:hypothetical protein